MIMPKGRVYAKEQIAAALQLYGKYKSMPKVIELLGYPALGTLLRSRKGSCHFIPPSRTDIHYHLKLASFENVSVLYPNHNPGRKKALDLEGEFAIPDQVRIKTTFRFQTDIIQSCFV